MATNTSKAPSRKVAATAIAVSLVSENPDIPKPRLVKLIVKNFRCIGNSPVEIDLNDIVVLVGANNVGKSSILKAYELAMFQGSNNAKLTIEDFPNNVVVDEHLPEVELHTIVYDNSPGDKWITIIENGERLVKERWIWSGPGHPKREGWDCETTTWSENVPWGAPNVANARRPDPHRVGAFDPPEEQADEIKKLLMSVVLGRLKNLQAATGAEENDYHLLLEKVRDLQNKIVDESQEQIDTVNEELSELISQVFPGYIVDFDAKPEDDIEKTLNLFKANAQLLMGEEGGHLSTIDRQGSGARRTLLWTALKYISENNQRNASEGTPVRPHLLLMDEPEICLHPNAIRDACNVLYGLPATGNWQVMVTTHSPIFVDFSRDNTTIIKVEKNTSGAIIGTTVFRPDKVRLDDNDKRNLKLLNMCDPYVAEFFFGGKVIIVEGDTEYTAFNYIKARNPERYRDVHIIRARGKATIVSLIKILNHFGTNYSVLHDSDTPRTSDGSRANPAWGNNGNILAEINNRPSGINVRLLASLPNFELAYFGAEVTNDKPYNALQTISSNINKFDIVESLFRALIDHSATVPANCLEWSDLPLLQARVEELSS